MNSPAPEPLRPGGDHLWPGWDQKTPELLKKKPVYRRSWFIRLSLGSMAAVLLVLVVATFFFLRWRREQIAEMARQRHGLETFLSHREFAHFARAADAQLLATLNFIAARPVDTRKLLPSVVGWEDAHQAMPWTLSVPTLPVSAATDAPRIAAAARDLLRLLAGRGFSFGPEQRFTGRRLFLRMLNPFAVTFGEPEPEHSFPAIHRDRALQTLALDAYARHFGPDVTADEAEQFFALYATIGPAMWQAIEAAPAASPFTAPKG